jgi:hypothetical protein
MAGKKQSNNRLGYSENIQLGISSFTYGWMHRLFEERSELFLAIQKLFLLAEEHRIHLIQLGDNIPLSCYSDEVKYWIAGKSKSSGITVQLGGRGLSGENLDDYISLCSELEIQFLRFITDDENFEPGMEEIIRVIADRKRKLKNHGITLALENHDRLKAREMGNIVREINSKQVVICLDTVNSIGAGEDLSTVWRELGHFAEQVHVKDFGVRRLIHKMGFILEGKIMGKGDLDLQWLSRKMIRAGICKTAILEQWVPPDPDLMTTVLKEKTWADESISYLKNQPGFHI